MSYIVRCVIMSFVAWTGIRIIGKKSIAEMTSYDLAGIMIITTVAAEPLVYKISSKAAIGVFILAITSLLIGQLSLKKFFYNVDAKPMIVVANSIIMKKELKKARMNIPLLMAELRIKGYQNISDIQYAIIEPSGKMSVVPKSQVRPVQPKDLSIPTPPVNLSFPLIIDGSLIKNNLTFLQKDEAWLSQNLQAWSIGDIEEVLLAQIDSTGKLFVVPKNKEVSTPKIF